MSIHTQLARLQSQPDTNMSQISSSTPAPTDNTSNLACNLSATPASAEMSEWVWRRIASARAVRDARATRGRTVGASEVIVLVLADRVESLTREVAERDATLATIRAIAGETVQYIQTYTTGSSSTPEASHDQ